MIQKANDGIVVPIHDKGLCDVQIKVARPIDDSAVTVERMNEHTYTHDILRASVFVQQMPVKPGVGN